MFLIDGFLLFLALVLAPLAGRIRSRKWPWSPVRAWDSVANRRGLAVVLIGVASFMGCFLERLWFGIPDPLVHDEFSYLLAADTFHHGWLTNPTHPVWESFETFHVIQEPSYQSKYPPGQALFLALGMLLGHPIIGVWLSMALCCGAICWMLQAWMPPRWALLGAMLAMIRLVFTAPFISPLQWTLSYWGGGVAALGGALVFGAVRRIVDDLKTRDSLLLGLGLVIMAYSRPYEGLAASIPVAVLLLSWMLGLTDFPKPSPVKLLGRLVLPAGFTLAIGLAALGYYHYHVTGSALRMPAVVHQERYDVAPKFYWASPRPVPEYIAPELKKIHHDWEFEELYGRASFLQNAYKNTVVLLKFFLGYHLWIPVLAVPWLLLNRWMCFALAVLLVEFAALTMEIVFLPHYAGPVTPLIYYVMVQGLRRLRVCRRSGYYCRGFVRMLIVAVVSSCMAFLTLSPTLDKPFWKRHLDPTDMNKQRARIIRDLEAQGGKHLILVRYQPNHSAFDEWVANGADLDSANVVWARELDGSHNRRLLDYFSDRKVWLLEADVKPLKPISISRP